MLDMINMSDVILRSLANFQVVYGSLMIQVIYAFMFLVNKLRVLSHVAINNDV
jgi:hypothetical protein